MKQAATEKTRVENVADEAALEVPLIEEPDFAEAPPLYAAALPATSHLTGDSAAVATVAGGRGARLKRIAKPLANFFGAQLVVQLLAMLAGILVVRTMTKTEYAFYTVANTTQGTFTILTNLGANSALSALGGLVWQDKRLMGQLLQTALAVRKRFETVGALLIAPLLIWLLHSNGCPWPATLIITAGIVATVHYQINAQIYTIVPRLHAKLGVLQKIDLQVSGFRLLVLVAASFLLFNATTVTIIGLAAFMLQAFLSRQQAKIHADLQAPASAEDTRKIYQVVRHQAPLSLHYAVQGQITIFIISLFGSTQNIAEVGALGRLSLILGVISTVLGSVAVPRFARCQDVRQLKQIYFIVLGSVIAIGAGLLLLSLLFPRPFLWILGKQYSDLGGVLPYMIFATAATMVGNVITSLAAARAWLKNVWLAIPIIITTQIALLPFLDLSSIKDVILLSCLPSMVSWIVYLHRTRVFFSEMEAQQRPA